MLCDLYWEKKSCKKNAVYECARFSKISSDLILKFKLINVRVFLYYVYLKQN